MNDRESPISETEEEALYRYGDYLARGRLLPPRTDLEVTALRIQQALRVTETEQPTMQVQLKNAIWEEIMESTISTPSAWQRAPRTPAPHRRAARVREPIVAAPPRPTPRAVWSRFANVALVLVIALAAAGAWRSIGSPGLPSGGRDTTVPGGAGNSLPGLAAATPSATSGCNLVGDIPIITDLTEDAPPIAGTSLYLIRNDRTSVTDRRGTLKLGCPGASPIALAENVIGVAAGPWPGTVAVDVLPPDASDNAATARGYVNVITGATIAFAASSNETVNANAFAEGSPWVIGLAGDDRKTIEIVDLRTMEARPFGQVAGVEVPASEVLFVSTAAADGTLAIGFGADSRMLKTGTGAPGDLLLLGSSFADTHWVKVPASFPAISSVALSPDGKHAAVVSMGGSTDTPTSSKYGLIDIVNGREIGASAEIPYGDNPFVTWVEGGQAVAYLAGNELQTLSVSGSGLPQTIFTADSQLFQLQRTWNPDLVVAATRRDHGSDASADQTAQDMVYSVNLKTREVHQFSGIDASATVDWIKDAGALVMYQWDDSGPDTATYQVLDPVTGKQIGTIADAPSAQPKPRTMPAIGKDSFAVSDDGTVEIFTLGTQNIYAFIAGADGLTMRRIPSPDGLLSEQFLTAKIALSAGGSQLALSGAEDEGRTRYLLALDQPEATWLIIPDTAIGEAGSGTITFAVGTSG